jgi:tetratricopeptide (TPR) repeat protein
MPSRSRNSLAGAIGKWLFAVVVPASALAMGSLLPALLAAVTTVASISCALLWITPPSRTARAARWVLIAFAVLLFATVLQSVPLPSAVVAAIAPANAEVWSRALAPLHEPGPAWHPLTIAPPATHVEILRGVLYGSVFLAALRIAYSEDGTTFLARVVLASACLVAFSSLSHAAVHADKVFGIYKPRDAYGYVRGRVGPLLNPNHLAAYMNVGACIALGFFSGKRLVAPRSLLLGLAALFAGTSVWAASRGGTGSLVVGTLLIAGLSFYQRRRQATVAVAETVVVMVFLLAAGALLGLGASEVARGDLVTADVSKLRTSAAAARLIPIAPLFGVGRGGFETVFPLVRTDDVYMTFLAVENVILQWTIEWGVPVALFGFVALAIALRPSTVITAARPATGAWVAIVVVVLHDLVDFHLEVPGVVVIVAVCVAMVTSSRGVRSASERALNDMRTSRLLAFAMPALTAGVIAVVWPDAGHSLAEDRDALSHEALDARLPPDVFHSNLRAAMLRYPAEPFFPLVGAIRAQATDRANALPWVAHALERYPTFGRAHLVLGRFLTPHQRAQARLEYRLAYVSDRHLRGAIVREAPYLANDYDSAMELVPDGREGIEMLESLASALGERYPATAARLDDELLRRRPGAPGALVRRVQASMSDVANHHPWCGDGTQCAAEAIAAARQLVAREPDRCEPRVMLARLRILGGEAAAGLDELKENIDRTNERGKCLRELVRLSLDAKQTARANAAMDTALRSGCGARDECVALYTWLAQTEAGRGHLGRAITFYKRVAEISPDDDASLEHVAELSAKIGLFGEALEAYSRLARRHPEDPRWPAQLGAIRTKMEEERLSAPRTP